MDTENKKHPFAHLGPGPYRFVGFFDLGRVIAALHAGNINGYNNGLAAAPHDVGIGSCAHCGHGILNNYIIQTGEGKKFAIGSDCIAKLHCEDEFENMSEFEKHVRAAKRKQGQERRENQRKTLSQECRQLVQDNKDNLLFTRKLTGNFPNYMAYCEWYLKREHTLNGYKIFKKTVLAALSSGGSYR